MDALRIQNLRSLKDTQKVILNPLSIFVGQNSSGKSTFVRTFPLLRQTVTSRTRGPLLWFGHYVDFGSFQEACNKSSEEKNITFSYFFNSHNLKNDYYYYDQFSTDTAKIDMDLNLKISEDNKQNTYVNELNLSFANNFIKLIFTDQGIVQDFIVNDYQVNMLQSTYRVSQVGTIIPHIYEISSVAEQKGSNRKIRQFDANSIWKNLNLYIKKFAHGRTLEDTLDNIAHAVPLGTDQEMLNNLLLTKHHGAKWANHIKTWKTDNKDFINFKNLLIAAKTSSLLEQIDMYLTACAHNFYYMAPVRAHAERYYRKQSLDVDEVDPRGDNLVVFLRNLTDRERKNFQEWTNTYFNFKPKVTSSGGHYTLSIEQNSKETNLADMGFGFSQILPIISQLWKLSTQTQRNRYFRMKVPIFFVIEQPELHLHPKMQADIADVFVHAIEMAKKLNIDLRIIIETHSETIINRIGHKIASGELSNELVSISIFDKEFDADNTDVRFASYDNEGALNNWPYGFFYPEWK